MRNEAEHSPYFWKLYKYHDLDSEYVERHLLFLLLISLCISILLNVFLIVGIREMREITPDRLYKTVLRIEHWGESNWEQAYCLPPGDPRSVYAEC